MKGRFVLQNKCENTSKGRPYIGGLIILSGDMIVPGAKVMVFSFVSMAFETPKSVILALRSSPSRILLGVRSLWTIEGFLLWRNLRPRPASFSMDALTFSGMFLYPSTSSLRLSCIFSITIMGRVLIEGS